MDNDNITLEGILPDEGEFASAGDLQAVPNVVSIKDVLSEHLGKDFPDDETALKAVKDTFSYVGKAGQEVKELKNKLASLKPENLNRVEELERAIKETQFYADNPDYKPYKDIINSFKGQTPDEVVNSEAFKTVFGKMKSYDESEKSKSVLSSNPRLGQITDKMSQAREAQSKGNADMAAKFAVDAIADAYDQ